MVVYHRVQLINQVERGPVAATVVHYFVDELLKIRYKIASLGKDDRVDGLEDDAVLRDLLQKRNHSILAHGLEPIGEKPARRFLEYVDAMVGEEKPRTEAEHVTLRGL